MCEVGALVSGIGDTPDKEGMAPGHRAVTGQKGRRGRARRETVSPQLPLGSELGGGAGGPSLRMGRRERVLTPREPRLSSPCRP